MYLNVDEFAQIIQFTLQLISDNSKLNC